MRKNMRGINLLILFIILSSIAFADICLERDANGCVITTPNISCSSNYTIYNLSGSVVENKAMTNVVQGIYQFTPNLTQGSYTILLCSEHTTPLEVISSSERSATEGNLSTISVTVNNTAIAEEVWDLNLTSRFSSADDDNFISSLAGEMVVQIMRFIIQLNFFK